MSTTNSSTVTMTVTETANVLGISRSSAYECVRLGSSRRSGSAGESSCHVEPSRNSSNRRRSPAQRLPAEQCHRSLCGCCEMDHGTGLVPATSEQNLDDLRLQQ